MGTETFSLTIVLIILAIIILYIITTYFKLKKLKNTLTEQWNQVKIELKEKFDLIPEVLEILKKHASNENDVIKGIIESRNKWTVASNSIQEIDANNQLTNAFKNVLSLSSKYNSLKEDTSFISVNKSLSETENKISNLKTIYNNTVKEYNKKIKKFPSNLIASPLNFEPATFFDDIK